MKLKTATFINNLKKKIYTKSVNNDFKIWFFLVSFELEFFDIIKYNLPANSIQELFKNSIFSTITEFVEEKFFGDRLKYRISRFNVKNLNFYFGNRWKYDIHRFYNENVKVLIYLLFVYLI